MVQVCCTRIPKGKRLNLKKEKERCNNRIVYLSTVVRGTVLEVTPRSRPSFQITLLRQRDDNCTKTIKFK